MWDEVLVADLPLSLSLKFYFFLYDTQHAFFFVL
jgi:hypothetical protein